MGRPVPNLSGKTFGKLTVLYRSDNHVDSKGHKRAMWKCRCDCGNETIVSTTNLKSGNIKSCGKCNGKTRNEKGQYEKWGNIKDITGMKYGKLTVIGLDKIVNKKSYWLVKCECGTVKSVRGDTLKSITSCGCEKKKQDIINLKIKSNHKMTYHPAFRIWQAMIARCENPNQKFYSNYGGRGIKVCPDWHDIKKFAEWADETGFVAGKNLSIERKDVNGNYCPENCCWIDKKLQPRNRRNTIKFKIDNVERPLSEWAEIYDVPYKKVIGRYYNGKRDPDDLFYKGNLQMRDLGRG